MQYKADKIVKLNPDYCFNNVINVTVGLIYLLAALTYRMAFDLTNFIVDKPTVPTARLPPYQGS